METWMVHLFGIVAHGFTAAHLFGWYELESSQLSMSISIGVAYLFAQWARKQAQKDAQAQARRPAKKKKVD